MVVDSFRLVIIFKANQYRKNNKQEEESTEFRDKIAIKRVKFKWCKTSKRPNYFLNSQMYL